MNYKPPIKTIVGPTKPITVKMPEDAYDDLQKMATEAKVTITALVRDMIDYCLYRSGDDKDE